MASMDIDMTLDDMITTNKKKSQPRSAKRAPKGAAAAAPAAGGARARYAGGAGVPAANGRQAQAAAAIQAGGNTKMAGEAFKIIVSNLPLDVDDAAVKDLFDSTIGRTRECALTYDRNGKHKGVATVVFQAKGDAQKAFKTYNNRLVDGRTPMKVELVFSKPPAPVQTLASRVAAPIAAPAAPRGAARPKKGGKAAAAGAKPADSGRRPQKSQADLDAEMDNWKSAESSTAATAAPAAETAL